MKYKFQLILMCVVGGLLLAFLLGRYDYKSIELTPDSFAYHFLAVNMMQGKGYYGGPVGSIGDYNVQTNERFAVKRIVKLDSPTLSRTPGYPIFLMLIYSIHGINPDAVLPYQIVLTGFVGALVVLTGWLIWGNFGAIAGLVAVFVLGMNRDAAYPVSQLLSECLATFFLTSSAAAAAWAKKGEAKREMIVSLLFALAILTRPALVFVGLAYGTILILQSIRVSMKRIVMFAIPCVIILSVWCFYASFQAGRFVPLATHGVYNMISGLDPIGTAKKAGIEPPQLNVKSLSRFWGGPVYSQKRSLREVLDQLPNRWYEVLKITKLKIKVGTDWLPRPLWTCMLMGYALIGSIFLRLDNRESVNDVLTLFVVPCGLIRSRKWIERVFIAATVLMGIIVLGFSTTIIQVFFLILPMVAPLFRIEIVAKKTFEKYSNDIWPYWIVSWYWGFLLMTLTTFGLRRFMRPYLPIFYLCATISIPFLAMVLLGLNKGSLELRRSIYFKFVSDEVKP